MLADASSTTDALSIDAFDYPDSWARIASAPSARRDEARLLVYDRRSDRVAHRIFRDLPDYCAPGDAVVVNDSRVIPARLEGVKVPTGGRVELLLVRRGPDGVWSALVKGKVAAGQRVAFEPDGEGEILERDEAGRHRVRLVPDGTAWLERAGRVPLPPYLRRGGDHEHDAVDDRERYQTIFAAVDGSVAAPTAGLHFTDAVLERLRQSGVAVVTVTLHVGPGTFEPIRAASLAGHAMQPEWGEVTAQTADVLNAARAWGGRLIAVGTTTSRLLESAVAEDGRIAARRGEISLFIRPGHRWRAVDALVTNFHLPRSTPLLLASAFCGRETLMRLYREAADHDYRFYSYGDAMLIR